MKTRPTSTFTALALAALTVAALAATADAATLHGSVVDAHSGLPVDDARVVALEPGVGSDTDDNGAFALEIGGLAWVTLVVRLPGVEVSEGHETRWIEQSPNRPALLHVFDPRTTPSSSTTWGAPLPERPRAAGEPVDVQSVRLPTDTPHPLRLVIPPGPLPTEIRVGRRFASSCFGNPIDRIDTVPLEAYVEGVLLPEIGVFQSVEGGPDAAEEVFRAFAVAARSYAVWFYYLDPGADWHIDDTACNQRYEEARNAWVAEQVAATRGEILVRASDRRVLDKYEYASSCGRHGSRPAYQSTLVPDVTGLTACVGRWCGHNDCAAHEVNPAVPGDERCLVRGICQWGAVERSMRGDDYRTILAHYQPNLVVSDLALPPPPTRVVGFVRVGDIYEGAGVPDVTATLDSGPSGVTDERGFFEIDDATPGDAVVSVDGGGIVATSREVVVVEGITNWASIAVGLEAGPADPSPDVGSVADAGDAGTEDTTIDTTDTEPELVGGDSDVATRETGVSDVGAGDPVPRDTGAGADASDGSAPDSTGSGFADGTGDSNPATSADARVPGRRPTGSADADADEDQSRGRRGCATLASHASSEQAVALMLAMVVGLRLRLRRA